LRSSSSKTETLSSCSCLHQVGGTGWNGGKSIASDVPVGGFGWAVGCASSGVVASVSGWWCGSLERSLKSSEVGSFGDGSVRVDGDESEFASFLGVLVDETTRVDAGHFCVVESSHFLELAGIGVATILRQAFEVLVNIH